MPPGSIHVTRKLFPYCAARVSGMANTRMALFICRSLLSTVDDLRRLSFCRLSVNDRCPESQEGPEAAGNSRAQRRTCRSLTSRRIRRLGAPHAELRVVFSLVPMVLSLSRAIQRARAGGDMRGTFFIVIALCLIALGAAMPAWTHHSFAAEYDLKKAI